MARTIKEYVGQANPIQVNDLLFDVMRRYRELNPDHEVYLFTLPREDGEEREQQLEQAIVRIRNHW